MNNLYQSASEKKAQAEAILVLPGITPEQREEAKNLIAEAKALIEQADMLKDAKSIEVDLSQPVMPAALPTASTPEVDPAEAKAQDEARFQKSVHVLRYGNDIDDNTSLVMREVYDGDDYRQLNYDQVKAFVGFLRGGEAARILKRQVWNIGDVKSMLRDGMTVAEIKATMVEGQDILGGYAVPVEMGNQIIQRAYGLTAVRSGGATVVRTSSKAIEWLSLTGADSDGRFATNLRGYWGTETKNPPSETNLTYGLENIPVHVYTYKVPMSTSFLEDAQNVAMIFSSHVADTLGIDEDYAFLVGDGVGKPRGILPASANSEGLNSVASLSASGVTMDGLKKLRRGVQSQYRGQGRASWIGNNGTGEALELLKDGEGRYFFEDGLVAGQAAAGGVWRESEAMPDIAASAFPILYGDLFGYMIVERLGLSIQRYNDSNTGINNVEFHVRRRIGGRLVEPWKMAVQTIAAS